MELEENQELAYLFRYPLLAYSWCDRRTHWWTCTKNYKGEPTPTITGVIYPNRQLVQNCYILCIYDQICNASN